MTAARLTWEPLPPESDPSVLSKDQIAAELTQHPGRSAIIARHDRAARAASHAERINDGREFGPGFQAKAMQIGSEHRVYAWAN